MKNYLILLLFFIVYNGFAQEQEKKNDVKEDSKITYIKFDFSVPLKANQYAGEIDPYTGETGYWFLPDGLSARVGFGAHYDKWIGAGINIGMDWKGSQCLVIAPIFGSFRISPRVSEDVRITLEAGYGRSLVISGDHLSGYFKKLSIGVDSEESGFGLYVELNNYGFYKNYSDTIGSLSLGLTYQIF
jgi:hypothetical protein